MPRTIVDGELRATWADTITSLTSPSAAEIEGGWDMTPFTRSLDTPLEGEAVDASDISTAFNITAPGRFGGSVTVQMYRDDTTDTAWTSLPRGTTGYVCIRRFGGSGVAISSGNTVEIWPVRVITQSPATADSGSIQMFTVEMATTAEPSIDVTAAV